MPSTSPAKRSVAGEAHVDAVAPLDLLRRDDALRLAGQQAQRADAVAADVHQRAALELGLQANVAGVGSGAERERRAHERSAPDRAVATSARSASSAGGGAT